MKDSDGKSKMAATWRETYWVWPGKICLSPFFQKGVWISWAVPQSAFPANTISILFFVQDILIRSDIIREPTKWGFA
jgi:hypothetical protein